MASTSNPKLISTAVGRRKTSVAFVRMYSNKEESTVNGKPISQYFPGVIAKTQLQLPFQAVEVTGKYSASVKVSGGGPRGQLDAVVLGLARALVVANAKFKPALRLAGLLTRDPRERQRRMVGTGGKSRRKKQSPKR
ncbi:MAG: 30S ribosomal protein S9 [Patescibacteria group bacterium]